MTVEPNLSSVTDPTVETVASDLEGTLSAGYSWRGMRDYLREHGHKTGLRLFYLMRLPDLISFRLGFLDERPFKERWISALLGRFRGFSEERFQEVAAWVVERELWPNRREEVIAELRQHRDAGRRVVLVSGLFQPLLDVFARTVGDVEALGSEVEVRDGVLTGRLAGPLNVGAEKAARLAAYTTEGQLYAAYGDSERDVAMLEMSRQPTAVHPDDVLREVAKERGWRILVEK